MVMPPGPPIAQYSQVDHSPQWRRLRTVWGQDGGGFALCARTGLFHQLAQDVPQCAARHDAKPQGASRYFVAVSAAVLAHLKHPRLAQVAYNASDCAAGEAQRPGKVGDGAAWVCGDAE